MLFTFDVEESEVLTKADGVKVGLEETSGEGSFPSSPVTQPAKGPEPLLALYAELWREAAGPVSATVKAVKAIPTSWGISKPLRRPAAAAAHRRH